MNINGGETDVTTYFVLRTAADGTATTGATITDIDLQYTRESEAPTAKVDATALAAADSAHSDNKAFEIDATDQPGVYRVDWPDAAFVAGAKQVILTVKLAGSFSENLAVDIDAPVNVEKWKGTNVFEDTAGYPVSTIKDGTGQGEILTASGIADANIASIQNDALSAQNLKKQYDDVTGLSGDLFPATQAQVGNIGSGGTGAINRSMTDDNVLGALQSVSFVGVQTTGTFLNTQNDPSDYHVIDDTAGDIDIVYKVDVGSNFEAINLEFQGFLDGVNNVCVVQAYDFNAVGWETKGEIDGSALPNNITQEFSLLSRNTGTGADLGLAYFRFTCTAQTNPQLNVGLLISQAVNNSVSVGYANGRIYVDTINGTAGAIANFNGTADNPTDNWTDALSLSSSLGLTDFDIGNGSTILLSSDSSNFTLTGNGWILQLGGQIISAIHVDGASLVTGVSSASSSVDFHDCCVGAATLPPGKYDKCGFGKASGTFTAASVGEYIFVDCFSEIPGAATPAFVFTGLGPTTGINFRRWGGGSDFTLDSDCTLSHEILGGGDTSITTGGADAEIRGITRALTLVLSGAGTVQSDLISGPITISGTATTTVNLFGLSSAVSDTSSGTTVTDSTVSLINNADAVWDEVLTGALHNIINSAGRRLRQLADLVIHEGTAQGAGANGNQIVLDTGASAIDRTYDPSLITITSGTGIGQQRRVLQYEGATRTATVNRTWSPNPDATSGFQITPDPGGGTTNEGLAQAGTTNTITLNTLASSDDNAYVGQIVAIVSGLGDDQARIVSAYNGTTKVATLVRVWDTIPDTTSAYEMRIEGLSCVKLLSSDALTQIGDATTANLLADTTVTADATTTVSKILSDLKSMASGDFSKVGDVYTFKNTDGTTVSFTSTLASGGRTVT